MMEAKSKVTLLGIAVFCAFATTMGAVVVEEGDSASPAVGAAPASPRPANYGDRAMTLEAAACLTEELYDELMAATSSGNDRHVEYLDGRGCFVVRAGFSATVLELTWGGKVKARIFAPGGESVVAWTAMDRVVVAGESNR